MRLARFAALPLLLLAACSFGGASDAVSFESDDTARAVTLGEGDVVVTSTDGTVQLMVVGDTVRMQLSDSLRASVKAEVDSSLDADAGAIGSAIGGAVGKIVGGAMGFVVRVPVEEVENVRYEDGQIRFESRGNTKFTMSGRGNEDGDGKNGASFTPEDGERFVQAVKARQRGRGF
ncbi:MAG: hypothetical protein ACXW61_11670 [Gemmatirosa sp.]